MPLHRAAVITIGSELVEGLRVDTHTAEIARALAPRGFRVIEATSVGDDEDVAAEALARAASRNELVVVTGGLGPTHDDVTREAASRALGRGLRRDEEIARRLAAAARRHVEAEAAEQVLVQALVLDGAEVIDATTGTAPGQIVTIERCVVALLPGPPAEMRPMLAAVLARYPVVRAVPRELGVVGLSESDAQVRASRALAEVTGVALTVLACPGDVRVLLLDEGAGERGLDLAAEKVAESLGEHCYSKRGETLPEIVVTLAERSGLTISLAESCTGGLVASALTTVPGASQVFLGGVVSYSDEAKRDLLGVSERTLGEFGAVSEQTAAEMASGARGAFGADIAVAITGIAGPGGGSAEKPVGLVWFAVATPSDESRTTKRLFGSSSRESIRARATSTALDLLRRELLKYEE